MNKTKFFESQINFWSSKLKVKKPIIKINRRKGNWVASANNDTITYQPLTVKILSKLELTLMALHELGHLKTDYHPYLWIREYKAHKFALNAIKKYLPKKYKKALKITKAYTSLGNIGCYRVAFTELLKELT